MTWPARAFAGEHSPWSVCILGDDHFDGALEATFQGRTEQGRAFEVVRAARLEQLPACQIVFVDLPQAAERRAALAELKKRPVLTVGHAPEFLDEGGIIRLLAGERIEMSINLDQARAAALTIPSKMLEVSREVDGERRAEEAGDDPAGARRASAAGWRWRCSSRRCWPSRRRAAAFLLFERLTLEGRARGVVEPYAELVSVGAEAAVAFGDAARAQEILDTLRANAQILEAQIVLADGRELARYSARPQAPPSRAAATPRRRAGLAGPAHRRTWCRACTTARGCTW